MYLSLIFVTIIQSVYSCAPSGNAGIERTTTTTASPVCQPDDVTLGMGDGTSTVDVTYELYEDALSVAAMTITCKSDSALKTVTMTVDGAKPTALPNDIPIVAMPVTCKHSENTWKYGTSTEVTSIECALN